MKTTAAVLLASAVLSDAAKPNHLARTPAMGWNSWNHFACDISEDLIKATADAIVDLGLAELGYTYLNLDDCWQGVRGSDGVIQVDGDRFPSGMKALADYVHSKGLKFGIYSSAGFRTCQGLPASLGLEQIDADTYAAWGVDYLKYDNCYIDHGLPQHRYPAMANALQNSGRDILYSLCEWGRENPATWASEFSHSWRTSGDIRDDWTSIISRADIAAPLWRFAGPGGWNDPDMLEVGNGGCSRAEYEAHFSLWSLLKSPLIIGNDVRGMSKQDEAYEILTNAEVIAVNQDSLGYQGRRVWSDTIGEQRVIATKCATGTNSPADDERDQQWVLGEGRIVNKASGLCLSEAGDSNFTSVGDYNFGPDAVVARDCSKATEWTASDGEVISASSGQCLEVAAFELVPLSQGKKVQTKFCQKKRKHDKNYFDIREHQSWTFPYGTMLNLYQRQCLTVDRDAAPGMKEIWSTELSTGEIVVLFLNKEKKEVDMKLTWDMIGVVGGISMQARDLWKHENYTEVSVDKIVVTVESHGVVMLKLSPV